MGLDLPPHLEEIIRQKIATGRYASASEVIAEALEVLDEREQLREIRLRKLRAQIQVGLDQAERGEMREVDFKQLKAEARRLYQATHKESA